MDALYYYYNMQITCMSLWGGGNGGWVALSVLQPRSGKDRKTPVLNDLINRSLTRAGIPNIKPFSTTHPGCRERTESDLMD